MKVVNSIPAGHI